MMDEVRRVELFYVNSQGHAQRVPTVVWHVGDYVETYLFDSSD